MRTAATSQPATHEIHRHGPPLARAGWVAKGAVFAIMAVLAVRLAFGDAARPDPQGALEAVSRQGPGQALLLALAAGLTLYCLGRLLEATLFADPHEGAGHRLRAVASAVAYGVVAVVAWSQALGGGSSTSGQRSDPSSVTARVMENSGGRWLVAAVGLGLIAVGAWFVRSGWKREFLEELDTGSMSPQTRRWVERLGVAGQASRGVALAIVGWFLVRAAWQFDPREARGLDQSLQTLAGEWWGILLLLLVAAGFASYGAFCLVEARHRRVD